MSDRVPELRARRPEVSLAGEVVTGVRWALGTAVHSTAHVVGWYERQALTLLRVRLDAVTAAAPPPAPREVQARRGDLGSRLRSLLHDTLDQDSVRSRETLFHHLLDQLVPDEARIIGALSDGGLSPVVSVHARQLGSRPAEPVLENMSLVGRSATLALPVMTPLYVGHLLGLGLVELVAEDPGLSTDFEVLMADTVVLRAVRAASRGPVPARVKRHCLRLSPLGAELWAVATGEGT